MKKVIVFGGSGFLGSHVADALTDVGHDVVIYDMKSSPYLRPNQKMIIGDILDETNVYNAMRGCDYVYHFAGFADLDDATTKPLETVQKNIVGTVVLLEAAKRAEIERFVYASTMYVYSDKGGFYRCSKQAAETYIEEYSKRFGLKYTMLRYGTLYGPRADIRNSVYRYVKQALTENKIDCPGTGEEIREYIHVKDAAKLSVEILQAEFENVPITITGPHTLKLMHLLNAIKEMHGGKVDIVVDQNLTPAHYTFTPYSFIPKIGKKLTSNYYHDIGQGLLECVNEIYVSLNQSNKDA